MERRGRDCRVDRSVFLMKIESDGERAIDAHKTLGAVQAKDFLLATGKFYLTTSETPEVGKKFFSVVNNALQVSSGLVLFHFLLQYEPSSQATFNSCGIPYVLEYPRPDLASIIITFHDAVR